MDALRPLRRNGKQGRTADTGEVVSSFTNQGYIIMKIAVAMCGAFVAALSTFSLSPAVAQQTPPPGAVMLVPGVYTTPEISAKCQAFAAKRVVGGSNTDTSRQAVALACAKKLMAKEAKKKKA